MQIVYRVNGRIFESEKAAKEFENSTRIEMVSQINEMKRSVLPKAYKRAVIAKENFSLIFKMSRKNIVKNAKEISDIIQEVAKSEIALELRICEYKKMREQLKRM